MTPSQENPGECVCGWTLDAIVPGHDRRHAQYLRATEGEAALSKPAAKTSSTKRVVDLTKAVTWPGIRGSTATS
ncbi:MAG: hypothetical protein IAI49_02400 [Candidatus Eremiobacteraeota bacterium]|nr:hypothetical protein [Candidatus Eremiobacteraeota bacterium]